LFVSGPQLLNWSAIHFVGETFLPMRLRMYCSVKTTVVCPIATVIGVPSSETISRVERTLCSFFRDMIRSIKTFSSPVISIRRFAFVLPCRTRIWSSRTSRSSSNRVSVTR